MRQNARILSIYAADTSGVCSMLYELGGLTVVHDASGCNSTYTTHDEPRWYDMDSMIYISGLTEMEAIMGDDDKLIADVVQSARELEPAFITLCGSPMPMMVGTDFPAIAQAIEAETGIPAFGLHTNGMHSYLTGASEALETLVRHFCREDIPRTAAPSANIIGATPLDFSVTGSVEAMEKWLEQKGYRVLSTMAMGSGLGDIAGAGAAWVNLVVSYSGLSTARYLEKRFGTPYVVGVPYGRDYADFLARELTAAVDSSQSRAACTRRSPADAADLVIVGESVGAGSMAAAMERETGRKIRLLCPLETESELMLPSDILGPDEDDAVAAFAQAAGVIADPLYLPVCPYTVPFYAQPHEAFSGRCYRRDIVSHINRPF